MSRGHHTGTVSEGEEVSPQRLLYQIDLPDHAADHPETLPGTRFTLINIHAADLHDNTTPLMHQVQDIQLPQVPPPSDAKDLHKQWSLIPQTPRPQLPIRSSQPQHYVSN